MGWTYDGAGNLTSDGTTSYSYDALNHLSGTTAGTQATAYTYNGDGTLVSQSANGTTTSYVQDLAASQSQILAATTGLTGTDYLYGQDIAPLAALSGGVRTWYGLDGQGSVRQTLDDTGIVLGNQNYDPFGQVEAGSNLTAPFGYTRKLQDATTGQEYLRARWYQPGSGTLLGVDPALASTGQPYAYAGNDPVNGSDPSGQCTFPGGQLPGIAGTGACAPAIQQSLVGAGGPVAGSVLNNQSAFIATINQELAQAEVAELGGQSGAASNILNGACSSPGACENANYGAYGAAARSASQSAGSASNGFATGLSLGTVSGTASQIGVAVILLNGHLALAIAVRSAGMEVPLWSYTCSDGTQVAGGAFAPVGSRTVTGGGTLAVAIGSVAVAGQPEDDPILIPALVIIGLGVLVSNIASKVIGTQTFPEPTVQPLNRGAIQIQGSDINYGAQQTQTAVNNRRFGNLSVHQQGDTLSSSWSRTTPISASEGRSRLALLWSYLNASQRQHRQGTGTGPNRVGAYSRAVEYINRCFAAGGCLPPGGSNFHDDNRSDPSYRIDIPIYSGIAFNSP